MRDAPSLEETVEKVLDRRERDRQWDEVRKKQQDERESIYSAPDHFTAAERCIASDAVDSSGSLFYANKGLAHAILAFVEMEMRRARMGA